MENAGHDSHHYFIGKRLNKDDAIKIRNMQQEIFQKNNYLQPETKVASMYTPYLYLGYFGEKVEDKLKHLLLPQFFAIAERFGPMKSHLKRYSFTGQSNNFQYLGLEYHTPDNYLENIIIPYIKSYMDNYTGLDLTYETIPMVPLLRLNANEMTKFANQNVYVKDESGKVVFTGLSMPNVKYDSSKKEKYIDIDSIDLLRATPINVKKGRKSFNEQLQIDVLMSIPLGGNKGEPRD